eukprot:TRINITY_DN7839_c0_g1_i2.p1 TRINITY_DN7839_c0_g1~~TRINITY_DN7839_c0_g1_i2.p1  ORF type:complete len:557 (+),score=143.15 TRINITY_DN7839_c0_g1_i2:99-1769(+)
MSSPKWHEGELALQAEVFGPRSAAVHRAAVDAYIRPYMPPQHATFFTSIPWVAIGTVSPSGQPWATLLQQPREGGPQLRVADDGKWFSIPKAMILPGDPAADHLGEGGDGRVGMLGIELHTRRRNRANGRRVAADGAPEDEFLEFETLESFGNCPKYIQTREVRVAGPPAHPPSRSRTAGLTGAAREVLAAADTVFIASQNPRGGVDVSHRGGPPGFLAITGDAVTMPDYPGNGFFNTLGNIRTEPRVGLLLIDFANNRAVHLECAAEVDMGRDGASDRKLRFTVSNTEVVSNALTLRFDAEPTERSPFNPPPPGAGEPLQFLGKRTETPEVATFLFEAPRNVFYRPGQYATFAIPALDAVRAWTLSATPPDTAWGNSRLEITVKRKEGGAVSTWLHDTPAEDIALRLLGVEGSFTLPRDLPAESDAAFAFACAGSGVTPVMSILRRLAAVAPGTSALVVYSVRQAHEVIFAEELAALSATWPGLRLHPTITGPGDAPDGCLRGRITSDLIRPLVSPGSVFHTLYICGPAAFAAAAQDAFTGVASLRNVVTESFDY